MVKISKILAKTSVEDAETHTKAKKIDAKGRRSRQKEVGEKKKRKRKVRPRAKTWEEKRIFGWGAPLFFPALDITTRRRARTWRRPTKIKAHAEAQEQRA
jgi:hypothetical protein